MAFQFSRAGARHAIWALGAAGMLLLMTGCDRDQEPESGIEGRPPELAQAYTQLQAGQPGEAYVAAHGYLDNGGGPWSAEALYLSGRAQADQGQFDSGKQHLEECIATTHSRSLKALAMLGRADCNMGLEHYHLASEQYHWIQANYTDVRALHQDEVMFKLAVAAKKAGNRDWANHWFRQVNEMYNTGPYAERARAEIVRTNAANRGTEVGETSYWLQVDAYGSQEKAEAVAADLRTKNYRDVEVVKTTRLSNDAWEVRVGKFNSRNAASRAQVDAQLIGLSTSVRPTTMILPH